MRAFTEKPVIAAGIAVLVLVGLFVYWPGLYGGYIFDDFANLVDDPDWKVTSLDVDAWRAAVSKGIASGTGRPLAMLSFAANHFFTGMDPFWLKLTGVALHLFTGVLILLLCRQLFSLMPPQDVTSRMGRYAATAIALAWTLHPLQVSSALYVVQRMEIGAATGTVLALLAYIRGRRAQIDATHYWHWFALSAAAICLGIGFKESAVLAPGYMLLIEVFALGFRTHAGKTSRPLQAFYLIGFIAALTFYLLRTLPAALAPGAYAFRDFELTERLLSQAHAFLLYLLQILAPLPDRLTFYYDNFPISSGLLSPPSTIAGVLLILAMGSIAWRTRRRYPLIGFGISWFFLAHSLTSNVIPLELVFEHRNYLALLGILLATSQILSVITRTLTPEARRILAALPTVGLAFLCALQVNTWAEPLRLAVALENRNPDSLRASYGLGMLMAERAESHDAPLYSMALEQLKHASSLPSRSPLPEQAIILMLSTSGLPVPVTTWERFRYKISAGLAGPEQTNALYGVLECRIRQLCKFDDAQLFQTFVTALQTNPDSALIHSLYANFAWNVMGDRKLAIEMMLHATELAPGASQFQQNLENFRAADAEQPAAPGQI